MYVSWSYKNVLLCPACLFVIVLLCSCGWPHSWDLASSAMYGSTPSCSQSYLGFFYGLMLFCCYSFYIYSGWGGLCNSMAWRTKNNFLLSGP